MIFRMASGFMKMRWVKYCNSKRTAYTKFTVWMLTPLNLNQRCSMKDEQRETMFNAWKDKA